MLEVQAEVSFFLSCRSDVRLPPLIPLTLASPASHPARFRRSGGRIGDSRWELTPSAAGLRVRGIEPYLTKLIEQDVRTRGCTLVALLPNLVASWHERFVGNAHEVHHVVGSLTFQNPLRNLEREGKGYTYGTVVRT